MQKKSICLALMPEMKRPQKVTLIFLSFGGKDFKLTMIFSLAEELREAFQKEVDVFEIHEVNRESTFFDTIMRERLLVA